jgi:hypothetical protein
VFSSFDFGITNERTTTGRCFFLSSRLLYNKVCRKVSLFFAKWLLPPQETRCLSDWKGRNDTMQEKDFKSQECEQESGWRKKFIPKFYPSSLFLPKKRRQTASG